MQLTEFVAKLDALSAAATSAFDSAADAPALEAARIEYLGAKSGKLKEAQKELGGVAKEDKPAAGKKFNEVKTAIESAFQSAQARLASGPAKKASGPLFDPTLPGKPLRIGHLHPITQTIEELKDIMGRLGFSVADGPEIEDEWHNFEALNIPADHPARDPLDNFFLATAAVVRRESPDPAENSDRRSPDPLATGRPAVAAVGGVGRPAPNGDSHPSPLTTHQSPLLLRSQTSTVQIRVMEETKPPVRVISIGRVYRPDEADKTHYPMFHQIEGLLVDRGITMAHLKSVLRMFATSYLGQDVHVRFRPSFFPFTEPSVEVDMHWNDRWIELGGAGMVDPNVLTAVGYDPEVVTGFAFGLGVERACMRRHGIEDIRFFHQNDVRFLSQF